jgi:hypothetical protein
VHVVVELIRIRHRRWDACWHQLDNGLLLEASARHSTRNEVPPLTSRTRTVDTAQVRPAQFDDNDL